MSFCTPSGFLTKYYTEGFTLPVKPIGKSQFWRYKADGKILLKLVLKKLGWWCVDWGFCGMWLKFSTFSVQAKKIIRSLRVALSNGSKKTDPPIFLSPSECEGISCLRSIQTFYPETVDKSRLCCWLPRSSFSEWCWWGFRSVGLSRVMFLNRRAAARYRAPASIIPGHERFSWNLSLNNIINFWW